MGKSKKLRTADVAALREFHRKRKIAKYVVIATGVLFVGSFILDRVFGNLFWLVVLMLLTYLGAFVVLRNMSRCPYCDTIIMKKFEQQTYCPYCKRAIKPSAPRR